VFTTGANTDVFLDVNGTGATDLQVATLTGVFSTNNLVVRLDGADFAFNGTDEFVAIS
jgi:hypothetical protein